MARFNIWDILHTLTTKQIVEVPSENLDKDHNLIYKMLRSKKVNDLVNIGKDRDKGTIVLSKQSSHKYR